MVATAVGLDNTVLRANPEYELVLLDRLHVAELERTRPAREDEDEDAETYGILRPRRGSGLEPRHASVDVALLFLTLREPAPLPAYVLRRLQADTARVVKRLVLDSVLEIADGSRFISGTAAAKRLLSTHAVGGNGRIGELSRAALRYAQALEDIPLSSLAMRLYAFGARPVTPKVVRLIDGSSGTARYLGIEPGGEGWPALSAGWEQVVSPPEHQPHWLTFRARRRATSSKDGGGLWKLYVSPRVEDLPAAVAGVVGALHGARGVRAFKVGSSLAGLCRPDKLMVYFDRLDDLQQASVLLQHRLETCRAHGVPFTAAVTKDGLLSWGVDPATGARQTTDVSWRQWVTERLAEHLQLGLAQRDHVIEPWQFAIDRVGLDGVDPDTWAPVSALRRAAEGI